MNPLWLTRFYGVKDTFQLLSQRVESLGRLSAIANIAHLQGRLLEIKGPSEQQPVTSNGAKTNQS